MTIQERKAHYVKRYKEFPCGKDIEGTVDLLVVMCHGEATCNSTRGPASAGPERRKNGKRIL